MSGHSKWKTIQHKKGAQDAKRGQIFSKLSRELMALAKRGGGDPDTNPALRAVLQKAKGANMPADNIERAIRKGTGELGGVTFEEATYEGYAAGGIAVVVKALTDNRNRTASEIRYIFSRHGSSFATQGSVSRGFQRKGQIFVDASAADEDKLLGIVLEAGAEDLRQDGDQFEVLTDPSVFAEVAHALEKAGVKPLAAEVSLVPDSYVPVTEKSVASSVMRFVAELEGHDDVQGVYTNMNVDDDIIPDLEKEK